MCAVLICTHTGGGESIQRRVAVRGSDLQHALCLDPLGEDGKQFPRLPRDVKYLLLELARPGIILRAEVF